MADLSLHVGGDSHEAQEALHDAGGAAHEAHDSMHELKEKLGELKESFAVGTIAANAFEKVLESVKEGLAESWAEAAKAENAERQLAAAAGDMTKEFKEQAEAIANATARKSEDVEAMQTLLLRYGAAPDVIGKALVAAYDVAAQKGLEVNSVLQMMIRSAEANSESIGRLGVSYKTTGEFSENLANQIEAISGKFGGSAAIEAEGMTGRARAASNAIDEVKKSFGLLAGTFEDKIGVLSSVAMYFNTLAQSGSVMSSSMAAAGMALSKAQVSLGLGTAQGAQAIPSVDGKNKFAGGGVDVQMGQIELSPSAQYVKEQAKLDEAHLKAEDEWLAKQDEWHHKEMAEEEKHDDEMLKAKAKLFDEESKLQDEKQKLLLENLKQNDELDRKQVEGYTKAEDQQTKDLNDLWTNFETGRKAEANSMAMTGAKLGNAFGKAFEEGVRGGMNNAEDAMLDFVDAALTIVGGVVGGIAGEGNPAAVQAGQTLGHLLGSGIKSAAKHHDGDWIESYHSGGWPGLAADERPAILQTGERVLSRREVENAGGTAAVDSMARGGGGPVFQVHVSTFDAQNTREFFENQGGRGFYNALRTGRGQLTTLFGGN